MIYAWLLVGLFVAVSGGLLIASFYTGDELEQVNGLTSGKQSEDVPDSGPLEKPIGSALPGASTPAEGRS